MFLFQGSHLCSQHLADIYKYGPKPCPSSSRILAKPEVPRVLEMSCFIRRYLPVTPRPHPRLGGSSFCSKLQSWPQSVLQAYWMLRDCTCRCQD